MGFTQCDHKYKKSVQRAMREKKYPFFAWYDTFFGIVPPVIFIVATMLASLAGLVLTIVYAAMGSLLWGKALLLLMLMPPFLMYLFDLLYNALTMYIYRDAYAVLSRGEKAATLLFSPLFMFEYFPVFLHAHLYLLTGKQLGWAHTARLTQEILHQAQKSGAPRRGQHRQRIKTRAGSPRLFFCLILASSSGRWHAVQHFSWQRDGGSHFPGISPFPWLLPRGPQKKTQYFFGVSLRELARHPKLASVL